jgi:hypothetical protein
MVPNDSGRSGMSPGLGGGVQLLGALEPAGAAGVARGSGPVESVGAGAENGDVVGGIHELFSVTLILSSPTQHRRTSVHAFTLD